MEIESSPGSGTCISLIVPGVAEEPAPRTTPELSSEIVEPKKDERAFRRIRVLLADDHALMRQGLATVLTEEGFEVVAQADNGHEAVQLACRIRPDVVLMDVSMPGLDGIEATAELHKADPEMRVIGLSMHNDSETAVKMIAAGAVAYLCKSDPMEKVVEAIRKAARQPA